MVMLYCQKKEKNQSLCSSCEELIQYACMRLDKCIFGLSKPACRKCKIHCYKPSMRERIKSVMRFSGPRMFMYAPWTTIHHWMDKYNE